MFTMKVVLCAHLRTFVYIVGLTAAFATCSYRCVVVSKRCISSNLYDKLKTISVSYIVWLSRTRSFHIPFTEAYFSDLL